MIVLRQLFQRRHLLQHANGVVDDEYLNRSGDTAFHVGERIVVKVDDLISYSCALRNLATGLLESSQLEQ